MMLNNLTWAQYFSAVVLLLVVYYFIIGVLFYRHDVTALLSGKKGLAFRSASSDSGGQPDEEPNGKIPSVQPQLFPSIITNSTLAEEEVDPVEQVRELTKSLSSVIAAAAEKNYIKEEFFLSLRLLLKNYSFLKGSPSMGAINNLIASECEKHGYIQLSAEERVMIWNE